MSKAAISDEEITAALLSNGTVRAAAAVVGISERALYDRMNTDNFQTLYKAAKADLLRGVVFDLERQMQAAVNTVCAIMEDESNNPAIRLQAAQTILNNAGRFAKHLQAEETGTQQQAESSRFGIGL